ncbi:glycosyltransferase [Streptomyces sp. NPDC002490]|uniref:glycosyltransferase family 2 protein n=1 Tax=Streptomyces sp. NPDC002490 TaxID=3154416 RepID=UPI003316F020
MPLVSVVMPVYNSAATLGAAVRSVLTQTHSDLELLVTDDKSSDGSMDLLMEFARQDKRVLPGSAPEQGGAARARNLAIERARGEYVAFLDSDDMWLPEKTERQIEFAAAGSAPLTFTSYFKMDADDDGESTDFIPNGRVIHARAHVDYRAMLVRDHIGALTAMYDRTVLGTRLMPEMRKRQDYALWLSIMREGADARGMPEPLAVYRSHRTGSLSSNKASLVRYNWELYREHEGLSVPRSARALAGAAWQSLRNSRI